MTSTVVYRLQRTYGGSYLLYASWGSDGAFTIDGFTVKSSGSIGSYMEFRANSYPVMNNYSSAVVTKDRTIRFYY